MLLPRRAPPASQRKTRSPFRAVPRRFPHAAFPNGVFFVALAAVQDVELVAASIAQTLGVRESEGLPISASLTDFLEQKQILLDNFEHLLAAAALVTDLLGACSGLKVLVTSREPLRLSSEHEWAVPPLALPEPAQQFSLASLSQYAAVALFIERALGVKADFAVTNETAPAVAEICHRLDGLPLAIELAAARVKLLSPQALLARLDHRLALLTGGARDRPARQQTLRATIAWSHDLLTASEQQIFRRLAVFVGGCTLEAATEVTGDRGQGAEDSTDAGGSACAPARSSPLTPSPSPARGEGSPPPQSVSSPDVLDLVGSLLDKSLLKQEPAADGEPRFVMLETIREFALEQLEASGENEALQERHSEHFLSLVEEAGPALRGPEQLRWLRKLEAEQSNLRAAQVRALRTAAGGVRLMEPLLNFWWLQGHSTEGRRWLRELLKLPDAKARTEVRARALYIAGVLAWAQTDYAEARVYLQESVAIWRELGERARLGADGLANALVWLAFSEGGDRSGGREPGEESLALFRQSGNQWGAAFAQIVLGGILRGMGEAALARSLFEQSRDTFETVGDRWMLTVARFHLGRSAFYAHENATARALWLETLPVFREYGDQHHTAGQLNTLGQLAQVEGDAERAARLFGAEEMVRETYAIPLPPNLGAAYQRSLAAVRTTAGSEAFAAAWAAGRALSLDEAITYALTAAFPQEREQAPSASGASGTGAENAQGAALRTRLPDGLTEREVEVLRLVAAGRSNREIAAELVISLNTVLHHMSNILGKTGAANRTGALASPPSTTFSVERPRLSGARTGQRCDSVRGAGKGSNNWLAAAVEEASTIRLAFAAPELRVVDLRTLHARAMQIDSEGQSL
ncbi:MAG: LuxR C-terminal-related transcriptional regulator [Dehalococcoidia bacterium]